MAVLTPKQLLFVEEYCKDFNATQAAIRAGYSARSAKVQGSRMLTHEAVSGLLKERLAQRVEAVRLEADDLRRMWEKGITTDRNELAQLRRVACRYCHGANHEYQETPAERRARKKAHDDLLKRTPEREWARLPPFEELGGVGYTIKKDPHPDCPECFGEGIEHIVRQDTTKLSEGARLVFEGIDAKQGVPVVQVASRMEFMDRLAKHLGMMGEKAGGAGAPTPIEGEARELIPDDPIEAARVYQKLMQGGGKN